MKSILCTVCLTLSLFADKTPQTDPRLEQVGVENERGTYGANTAPALKHSVDSFFVWGEALYWTPKITGAGYAASHNGPSVDYPGNEKTKLIGFDWDWGMRIGAGYHTNFDAWDVATEFTYFKFNYSTSYTAPAGNIVLPVYVYNDIIPTPPLIQFCTQASVTYTIDYKTLSGALSRDFFVSKRVALTPVFGLKGAWIDHKQTNACTGGVRADGGIGSDSVNSTIQTNTKGVGPLVGLGTGWFLSNNWSFFGNCGLALIVTRLDPSVLYTYSGNPNTQKLQGAATLHQLIPNPSLALGIGYGTYFSKDTMHFNAKIGFETQYYNNQRIILDGAGSELTDTHYSDLSLYGFNFALGLDF